METFDLLNFHRIKQCFVTWFDSMKWREEYNISQRIISSEFGDVSSQTVDSWLKHMPFIIAGYKPQDIWIYDHSLIKALQGNNSPAKEEKI